MTESNKNANYSVLKRQQQYLSLTDIAYNALVEAIINQDFPPGSPVSIDSLAKQLNMSNTPVREALMRANGQGLVTQRTNHGFVVADILRPDEMSQLFEVRYLLETHALTIGEITPTAIETATNLIERMKSTGDGTVYSDFRDYLALDHQFHHLIVELSGNRFLLDSWEDLHVHLHLSRLYTGIGLFDRADSTSEHQAIWDALQLGDKKAAVQRLSHHIKRVGGRMQRFLNR
ncbi:MAG: GntR family transcriptional regulator [Anaerolineae bacterium]